MEAVFGLPQITEQEALFGEAPEVVKSSAELIDNFQYWVENSCRPPESVFDEFYQVSPEIIHCLPKYNFPMDLYEFNPVADSLLPAYEAGKRLSPKQRLKILSVCHKGNLFVSRKNHNIYIEFIVRQPDLILLDKNLLPHEVGNIFIKCFGLRLSELFHLMTADKFNQLELAAEILVEYLMEDLCRIDAVLAVGQKMNQPENKLVNTSFVAIALYIKYFKGRIIYDEFMAAVMGFFLFDIGMTRVPKFVTDKARSLDLKERVRVKEHPLEGVSILENFGVKQRETYMPCLEHHERMDGKGYPKGLKGSDISMLGKIMAMADSYTAMTTERSYAKAMSPVKAVLLLSKEKTKYDAGLCKLLMSIKMGTDHTFRQMLQKAAEMKRSAQPGKNGLIRSEAHRLAHVSRGQKTACACENPASGLKNKVLHCQAQAFETILRRSHFFLCKHLTERTIKFDPKKVHETCVPFKESVRKHLLYEYVSKLARLRRAALEHKAAGRDQNQMALELAQRINRNFCALVKEEFKNYALSYAKNASIEMGEDEVADLADTFYREIFRRVDGLSRDILVLFRLDAGEPGSTGNQ